MIFTDKELLKTALECFLSNAVSYSKSHQQVVADVEERDGKVIFSVSDSGIGIPESERKSLFDRFHRASNAIKYKPDGTGLGLYMASRIARHIGGTIWFDSIEGKGSTFYISVPKVTT
jgi:two-component system sensor histidine kinase VicK